MNISKLLSQRPALLEQTRLANLAFAYTKLAEFAARIARARLRGAATLRQAAPEAECFRATLTAHEAQPSVIEEHFTDEDVMDLADVLGFVAGENAAEILFRFEEFAEKFAAPLHRELKANGVAVDGTSCNGESIEHPAP